MLRIAIDNLPGSALAAAGYFYSHHLVVIRQMLGRGDDAVLLLSAADHAHNDWRKAAIAGLAREYTPARINGIAGGDCAAQDRAIEYLTKAPGVTGQYLPLNNDLPVDDG